MAGKAPATDRVARPLPIPRSTSSPSAIKQPSTPPPPDLLIVDWFFDILACLSEFPVGKHV